MVSHAPLILVRTNWRKIQSFKGFGGNEVVIRSIMGNIWKNLYQPNSRLDLGRTIISVVVDGKCCAMISHFVEKE